MENALAIFAGRINNTTRSRLSLCTNISRRWKMLWQYSRDGSTILQGQGCLCAQTFQEDGKCSGNIRGTDQQYYKVKAVFVHKHFKKMENALAIFAGRINNTTRSRLS